MRCVLDLGVAVRLLCCIVLVVGALLGAVVLRLPPQEGLQVLRAVWGWFAEKGVIVLILLFLVGLILRGLE